MKETLYRVRVLLSDDKAKDIGPALQKWAAQMLCDEILKQIRIGKEKTWHDPIIYPDYR